MDDSTVFSDHPADMAEQWVSQGAKRIHLVDLNGAFEGRPVNADAILEIVRKFPHAPVQIGGGIRSMSIADT
jgi:phosphoribosylformimino-5-aminoimidazole carboxamide ribotide isomerase